MYSFQVTPDNLPVSYHSVSVVSGRASIEEDGLSLADRDEPDDTVADDGPVLVFNYTDAVLSSDDTPPGDDPEEMTTAPPFVPNPGFKGRVTQKGLDYGEGFNSSPPGQNGRHFTDDNFRCIFVNEKF